VVNGNFFESPRTQRERIFLHSLYFFTPTIVIFGITDIVFGTWYLLAARASLLLIIVIVHFLRTHGHNRIAISITFWGAVAVVGVTSALVPPSLEQARATGEIFLAFTISGSIILMGLYAERRYQVNVMLFVALAVGSLSYLTSGDTILKSAHVVVAFLVLLLLCYIVARFEMHLSQVAETQLRARRMLNHHLEEIRLAESTALARAQQKSEELNHDIRNPLTVAMNVLNLLQLSELTDEQRGHLGILRDSFSTSMGIVDHQLIDSTRPPETRGAIETVRLATFMEHAVQEYRTVAADVGTSIDAYVADGVESIRLPLIDMTRIMSNLLHNAVKYTQNGKIEVTAELKPSITIGQKPTLRVTVKDTGSGMTRARLDDVRAGTAGPDVTRTTSRGIGLRSCGNILEGHGGSLQIESAIGVGTSIIVTLPLLW